MQTHRIPAGSTSVIIPVEVWDSSSATGAKLAGLAHDTASLTCYYNRAGASAGTAITLDVHPTQGTWSTRGFIAIDGTNMPGIYELHVPDACLATGAKFCNITLKGAANMVPVDIHIELETVTTEATAAHTDTTELLTRIPDATAGAANGLSIVGSAMTLAADSVDANALKTDAVTEIVHGIVDHDITTHTTAGTLAGQVNDIDAEVDPFKTGGQFHNILERLADGGDLDNIIDAIHGYGAPPTAGTIATAVWAVATSALSTAGSVGKRFIDFVTTLVYVAPDNTAIGNIHTDIATVQSDLTVIGTQLDDIHGTDLPSVKADTARVAGLIEGTFEGHGHDRFTAVALEAGPSESGLDAAGVRTAIGLASANLDTQIADLHTDVADIHAHAVTLENKVDDVTLTMDNIHGTDLPAVKTVVDAAATATSVADLHTDVGTAITNIADLHTDVGTVVTNVGDMHATDLPAVATAVAAVKTVVDAAAADAAAAHSKVDALHDFDPATDTVAHVTLVDTTTTNTDALQWLYEPPA